MDKYRLWREGTTALRLTYQKSDFYSDRATLKKQEQPLNIHSQLLKASKLKIQSNIKHYFRSWFNLTGK